ncbi:hypothetical protein JCGZ_08622 [Jatropha curcas]|uniref:Aminotransferase-like plant mobile domain-containing protein n=1 Tax=Jatropha curcas TaxID=180498 RepID=A0A067KPN1_JATCU|nr:hypothetical protein JCGZ_08622 [Jatropha curcas]
MSQISEIPTSAYTPEMETLGALSDIPTFDGEPVPVSRNSLTPGTQPLQLLPLPGTEFPVRYETSRMHGFQSEVNLGKAHSGGSATDASAFWDLLDPHMRARVVAAGFGDYAAGLRRTQPRFPPAMRYAFMERWNDCTHTFVFGFGEMTLTHVDYAAITGLRFAGPVPPLDGRYQTAALGAQLVRSLLGVTTQTRYTVQGCMSYEMIFRFWAETVRTRLEAWRELPEEARPAAPAYTREERDQAARSFLFYIISSQLLCTSQNKGDPAVLACLRDLSQVEVERLRTRLEVEGIPLDSSEEDEDGFSSDDAPPSPPPQAAAGPSRRQRSPLDPSLLLNVYALKNSQPGIGDFRLLTVVRDMQLYHRIVFMMIMGETMCWVRDIALHITDFNVHHRGCPLLLQAWALDKLSLIPPVPASLIPTYGAAFFNLGLGDASILGITLLFGGLVLGGGLDWISRQYGMIRRVPRVHNFESGLITPHLLTNLADRWRNRNTVYLDEGMM